MSTSNVRLEWFRTDTNASVGESFVPVSGITYVTDPMCMPTMATVGAWYYALVTGASTAGTLTLEVDNTPDNTVPGGGLAGAATLGNWVTYAPSGWTIAAISGASITHLSVALAPLAKRTRMKFLSSAAVGSVSGSGSVG